jgi:hypothetical protein
MPNHFHLLLRTGDAPVATVMRRLLTGHAVYFNKRHRRSGHLFQNRYKSILCQQDAYLSELVRYIHLNPVRANIVKDMDALDTYPWCGHSAVMGKVENVWQDVDGVLSLFAEGVGKARRHYRKFIEKGIGQGRRDDLIGGGLIRSAGGWESVKAMRKAKMFQKSDERILGDSVFVQQVLADAQEQMEQKHKLVAQGYTIDKVAGRVCTLMNIERNEIWSAGKQRKRVAARSLFCYWAVRKLGVSMTELARQLKLSLSGVSLAVNRGEQIARQNNYHIVD